MSESTYSLTALVVTSALSALTFYLFNAAYVFVTGTFTNQVANQQTINQNLLRLTELLNETKQVANNSASNSKILVEYFNKLETDRQQMLATQAGGSQVAQQNPAPQANNIAQPQRSGAASARVAESVAKYTKDVAVEDSDVAPIKVDAKKATGAGKK